MIDVDRFIGEVHGKHKQGASYGYTTRARLPPDDRVRAGSGELLHLRFREGKANTQRGIIRFVDELIARVRRAGDSERSWCAPTRGLRIAASRQACRPGRTCTRQRQVDPPAELAADRADR